MIPRNAYDMFSGTVAKRDKEENLLCPNCNKPMAKVPKYPQRYKCGEHGLFRIRPKPKNKKGFDYNNSNTWKATCGECGGIMDYYNLKYCCRKCGGILEV